MSIQLKDRTSPAQASAPARPRSRAARARRRTQWLHVILAPMALLWMIPVIMVIGLSLLPQSNPSTTFFNILPAQPSLSNYSLVFEQNDVWRNLLNSIIITVPSVLLTAFLGSMTAFALARLRVPLKAVIFGVLTIALVLPMSAIVVATFHVLQGIGLYNNLIGVSLVYTALGLPFAVIVVRTSFLAVPEETYQAALIDGANKWKIFWRIYLPLARPSLAVVVIWQAMLAWNDFLLPLVDIVNSSLKPLTLIPLVYRGEFLDQPGALFAILLVISVPMALVFIGVQRLLVNGLAGAIK